MDGWMDTLELGGVGVDGGGGSRSFDLGDDDLLWRMFKFLDN